MGKELKSKNYKKSFLRRKLIRNFQNLEYSFNKMIIIIFLLKYLNNITKHNYNEIFKSKFILIGRGYK